MLMNQRGEFYQNYEKRGYSKSLCWTKEQKHGTIWFNVAGPSSAIKHIKTRVDKIDSITILVKEIDLPNENDVYKKFDFKELL